MIGENLLLDPSFLQKKGAICMGLQHQEGPEERKDLHGKKVQMQDYP